MAEQFSQTSIEHLLESLDLKSFYPEKLTHHDLYQITEDGLYPEQRNKCSPAWQFIYNITRYNYHARNIKSSDNNSVASHKMGFRERSRRQRENNSGQIHPLDILVAVFLCCDPAAKQDLATHLWGCKLAIPFAVSSKQDTVEVFCWPIRSLIGQFHVDGKFTENQLIHVPMKCTAILRIGENEKYSKSHLLNCLIGGSEKQHPIFFHRNSEGSKKCRSNLTNGLVEIAWSLPSEGRNTRAKEPRLFVNLRGDANELDDHVHLVGQMATVSFLLCTVQSLKSTVKVVNNILQNGSCVIIIVTDQEPDGDVISDFLETSFGDIPETKLDIVTSERLVLSEFLETLLYNLDKIEHNTEKKIIISDFVTVLSKRFSVDENGEVFRGPFEYSNKIVTLIKDVHPEERKKHLLPLQDRFWKEWSKLDRNFFRFDQLDKEDKIKYKNKKHLTQKMKMIRESQYKHFVKNGISKPVMIFIDAVSTLGCKYRRVFIRMLKLELDKLSRGYMRPIYERYQELVHQTVSAKEEERIAINRQLSKLDEMKSNLSFGMEHLIREIGQLFEACESQAEENILVIKEPGKVLLHKVLPRYACYILLDGLPIEILDGEACSVPLLWIKQLFKNMPEVLRETGLVEKLTRDISVHTVSVLGIQSSGKSTFLNTIFGLQFAVSAGRCTRGAFMQVIKVHPSLAKELKIDFLFAIDTEGLKAPELISSESVKHDNELSTFVIGLADTTVINLMGENATYLQENLPIAVHAFLRMNMVGLHPRCTIVHHNVDKQNKEKLLQQGRILETVLNKLTTKACELENIPHRLFHELIEFSIANHTDYIPALYEGEQPMAPINVGYSMESDCVRTKLIQFVFSETQVEKTSVSYFAHHLERLWCAIKKDRFVYEFRTTLETEARMELERGYSKVLSDFLREVNDDMLKYIGLIKNKRCSLASVKENFLNSVEDMETSARENLERFIGRPKKISSSIYDQWKEQYMKNLEVEIKSTRESSIEQLTNCWTEQKPIPMEKFEEFFNLMKSEQTSDFDTCFTKAWSKWAQQLGIESAEDLILTHATVALQEVCPSHAHLLEETSVEQSSLSYFRPSLKHINRDFHDFSEEEIHVLLQTLQRVSRAMYYQYRQKVTNIENREIPYTYWTPKQILLSIHESLNKWLSENDKPRKVSNSFKIDILLCTAGSIVKDLYRIVQETSHTGFLKREMMNLTKKKIHDSQQAAEMVIDLLILAIKSILSSRKFSLVQTCIMEAFEMSKFKPFYQSKQTLLSLILFGIIRADDDDYLNEYLYSPNIAMRSFTKAYVSQVTKETNFSDKIRQKIKSHTNELVLVIQSLDESEDAVGKIINNVAKCETVSVDIIMMLQAKCKNCQHTSVNLPLLKKKFPRRYQECLHEWTQRLIGISNSDSVFEYCSSLLLRPITGCNKLCPFCKEICKYSQNHPGTHECLLHRPVGLGGYHWKATEQLSCETCDIHFEQNNRFKYREEWINFRDFRHVYKDWQIREPTQGQESVVWKWIFVNKYNVIEKARDLQLPSNLPEEWKSINKKEVLRALIEIAYLD